VLTGSNSPRWTLSRRVRVEPGLGKSERARSERDWLIDQLAAATGLAGRVRNFTGNDERARVSVGKAIRRALKRIANVDPVIGEALEVGVHTGLRCSYRPY